MAQNSSSADVVYGGQTPDPANAQRPAFPAGLPYDPHYARRRFLQPQHFTPDRHHRAELPFRPVLTPEEAEARDRARMQAILSEITPKLGGS